jgi:hypothetical protein
MFDRYVSGKRPSWKRRALLIGSLGLHGAAALGLMVAGLFHVAEITPPPLSIVFVPVPPPEGAKAKSREPEARTKKPPATRTQHPLVQPTKVPATAPVVQPPPDEPPATGGEEIGGGEMGGNGTGGGKTGDGPGDGPGTGIALRIPPIKPRNIPYTLDNQRISGEAPHLPDFVKITRKGLGETPFLARVCVDQAGNVSAVEVMQGIPGADDQIVRTLRGWRYKPQPIPVCFLSRVVFSVQ